MEIQQPKARAALDFREIARAALLADHGLTHRSRPIPWDRPKPLGGHAPAAGDNRFPRMTARRRPKSKKGAR